MDLKSLIKKDTVISVSYPDPDFKDFMLKVSHASRDDMLAIRKKCLAHSYNKKTRAMEESIDEDKFVESYVAAIVKEWSGFKYKYLAELLPIDLSSVKEDDCLPYSQDNAVMLMKESSVFEASVGDLVSDISLFSKA